MVVEWVSGITAAGKIRGGKAVAGSRQQPGLRESPLGKAGRGVASSQGSARPPVRMAAGPQTIETPTAGVPTSVRDLCLRSIAELQVISPL